MLSVSPRFHCSPFSFPKTLGPLPTLAKFPKISRYRFFFLYLSLMHVSWWSSLSFQSIRFGNSCIRTKNTYLPCYVPRSKWVIANPYLMSSENSRPLLLPVLVLFNPRLAIHSMVVRQLLAASQGDTSRILSHEECCVWHVHPHLTQESLTQA